MNLILPADTRGANMHRRAPNTYLGRRLLGRLGISVLLAAVFGSVACAGPAAPPDPSGSRRIGIVAAENFYGDIATQIGGDRVSVVSILSDPSTDPHAYESNTNDAKAIANAQVVIENSLGYDAFIERLMNASPRPNRTVLNAGELTGHKEGDNPHVWYDPATMPKVAVQLTALLTQLDPSGRDYYEARLQTFTASMKAMTDQVSAIRAKYKGARVLATEPIFEYMAEALGLDEAGKQGAFQRAVEDGNDPPAAAVAEFRAQLSSRTVKVLVYNSQAVTPITQQMQDFARQNNVPVVAVSETLPEGKTYQQWIGDQLKSLLQALGG